MADSNDDVTRARAFLAGIEHDRKAHPDYDWKQFERDACAALARLLRSPKPLPAGLREQMAEWFDHLHRQGRRRDHVRNTEIADHIWKSVGEGTKVESAIAEAMAKFGLKRRQIMSIWGPYQRIYEALSTQLGERY